MSSLSQELTKPYVCADCSAKYTQRSNLSRHHKGNPEHKVNVTSAKDAVRTFLPQELSEYNRRTRIREFMRELNTNKIQEIILPFAAKIFSPYNFQVSRWKALSWRNATNANNLARYMQKEYTDLSRDIAENDPEVSRKLSFNPSSFETKGNISTDLGSYVLDLNVF